MIRHEPAESYSKDFNQHAEKGTVSICVLASFTRRAVPERFLDPDAASPRSRHPDPFSPESAADGSTENCRNSPRSMLETSGWRTPRSSAASVCFIWRFFMIVSILKTNCAFTRCSSAFGTPISRKTLPLPDSWTLLLMLSLLSQFAPPRANDAQSTRCPGVESRVRSSISSGKREARTPHFDIGAYTRREMYRHDSH